MSDADEIWALVTCLVLNCDAGTKATLRLLSKPIGDAVFAATASLSWPKPFQKPIVAEDLRVLAKCPCLIKLRAWNLDLKHLLTVSAAHLGRLKKFESRCSRGDLEPLAALTGLRCLDVASFSSTTGKAMDLGALSTLQALQSLNISSCKSVTSLAALAHLAALQNLDISSCSNVTSLAPLAALRALRSINARCTAVADLGPLAHLAALQSIDISMCKSVTSLVPLSALHALQSIDISLCHDVTSLAPLSALHALQSINANETRVSDLGPLAGLGRLRQLRCVRTEVSNLAPLAALTELRQLWCVGCRVEQNTALRPLRHLMKMHGLSVFLLDHK